MTPNEIFVAIVIVAIVAFLVHANMNDRNVEQEFNYLVDTVGSLLSSLKPAAPSTPPGTQPNDLPTGAPVPTGVEPESPTMPLPTEFKQAPGGPTPAIVKAPSAWGCYANYSSPMRFEPDDNVSCLSTDGANCSWSDIMACPDRLNNMPENINPLVCGTAHQALYGITGYDDPNHWCSVVQSLKP